MTTFDGITPTMKIQGKINESETLTTIYARTNATSSNRNYIYSYDYTYTHTDSNSFLTGLNNVKENYSSMLNMLGVSGTGFDIIIDMKNICNPTIELYFNSGSDYRFYVSDDGNTWVEKYGLERNKQLSLNFDEPHRFYKFKISSYATSTTELYYFYISKVSFAKRNKFTLDSNEATFTNNQRVLIEIPSTTSLTGVSSNSLNDINIDTLLEPTKYYEMLYKEDLNKFIAEEVRA